MTGSRAVGPLVLVVGAGPAGLFTAQALADRGIETVLLNRDIRPGGLAEYGIYHSKHKVKLGLRTQFTKILTAPQVTYYGNVTVGDAGDLTLDQLLGMGFAAVVIAVGAQGTKWLELPGEHLTGVYHAKDLIYYYNGLPPFSEWCFEIGKRVALIGVGNVMADIARWLVRELTVDEVIAVARRGPAEVKFTKQEAAHFAANLDVAALDAEFVRVRERMEAVNQDPEAAKAFIMSTLPIADARVSDTRVALRFLAAPSRILGDDLGRVAGLEVEDTALALSSEGDTRAQRLGTHHVLDVDTVVFCIGDRVSEDFGLPVKWFSFVKHPRPRYPIDGISYEAYNPDADDALSNVFLVGWARKASEGQVGLARKDARACVEAVAAHLATRALAVPSDSVRATLEAALARTGKPVVKTEDVLRLLKVEAREGDSRGDPGFRYKTNAEMLAAIGLDVEV